MSPATTTLQTTPDTILAPGVADEPAFDWVRGMFRDDRASHFLGITITSLSEGVCEGEFTLRPEMCNGHGNAQGGFLYAFADSLFAGACNSGGRAAVAAFNTMHYIAPGKEGQRIRGHAVQSDTWGRNGITDVELTCDGHVIAQFRGTSRVVTLK
ncbi:hydroxyphenylacetyl-CoA thioesterase PaaI [Corynebacterium sp. USCH3]|uniref:hydroxyphenylacetyl-CoA thioesterase PaaI n=1 Tax=Corynebacterium sp. USCH3 TaxID=3024840 RepID=UPI0030AC8D91